MTAANNAPPDPPLDEREDLRCSVVTASLAEPALGTAASADRFVLVELGGAWPKPITSHPLLASVDPDLLARDDNRLLAIGSTTEPATHHRVITYEQTGPPGTIRAYSGHEADVETAQLTSVIESALAGDTPGEPVASGTTDVLICTQGTHDRCCGRFGTLLYLANHDRFGADIRVWRTSHTGGHRFAPTGLTFPDAMTWAGLDDAVLRSIIERSATPEQLSRHLRGRAALGSRQEQIADAVALMSVGWAWLDDDVAVSSTTTSNGTADTEVRLSASEREPITVTLRAADVIAVPKCGRELSESTKTTQTYDVVSVV